MPKQNARKNKTRRRKASRKMEEFHFQRVMGIANTVRGAMDIFRSEMMDVIKQFADNRTEDKEITVE